VRIRNVPHEKGANGQRVGGSRGISERSATMLRTIARLRPDLLELIPSSYTINAAYRIARGEEPTINSPNSASWDRLVRAWDTAGEVERERFCQELGLVEGE
jgi:hypothetical protein